ncbi:metalloregulator ArsR/SmtB family transcription factor [Aliiglaciecola sp. 3_MG-2023]|uniref:metalloregulator ArsR/SmtB family transcription factor n=1 Tax=Aliiglaciecola sp. 3_MG-2023 TaxID=3062644 RepID=UPI0026E46834|nr:metalloregulator ArsR/SmtB family transcription factor [Aliiglaciecola sp. 3_MG-2023]MDO6693801.1 metalloregulator ArsR/SmtB family transcription factor [Aliiglaciecola sp. 3_MG-2023]
MSPLQFFKCLSDDTRLKSLMLIAESGELCVCDLMEALNLEQPKISRHLAELRKCELLRDERRGKWVYYRLHPELPEWANKVIRESSQHNKSYFEEALSRLKTSKISPSSCC